MVVRSACVGLFALGACAANAHDAPTVTIAQASGDGDDGAGGGPTAERELGRQCNRLIGTINSAQEHLGEQPDESFRQLGEQFAEVAQRTRSVRLSDSRLIGYRDDYSAFMQGLALTARNAASAEDRGEAAQAAQLGLVLIDEARKEAELVEAMNRYCRADPDPSEQSEEPPPDDSDSG